MRLMFKPESQTLWGFHQLLINQSKLFNTKDVIEPTSPEDIDEENDVDMKRTMWYVLRKTRPSNEVLKQFYAEQYSFPIKIKDIVKFGRVNFKVSALSSSKLDKDIQGQHETFKNPFSTTFINN